MKNRFLISACLALCACTQSVAPSTGILDFNPPEEVLTRLHTERKSAMIMEQYEGNPSVTLLHFSDLHGDAENLARDISEGDWDIYSSVFNSINAQQQPEDEHWMIEEFYRSMVMLICSVAETTIKSLLKNPDERFGSNFLCKAYKKLNEENSLGLKTIGKYWKGRQGFTKKRNDIAHRRRDVDVTKEELYEAINGVHKLLRAIADAFENIRRQALQGGSLLQNG